jgi:threonine synthase
MKTDNLEEPQWYCPYCGFRESIWKKYYWRCPRCGRPLKILFNREYSPRGKGLSRYSSMLPFKPLRSIGEGSTPLIELGDHGNTLLFKLEYMNPSGSFKDRGTLISISYAYKMGYREAVEDTSGNTGISVALYSRVFGMKSLIIMPRNAPRGKRELVKYLGAEIIEASDRGEASRIIGKFIDYSRYYVAHIWSYFYILGASTISFEVYDEGYTPDYMVVPLGSGGLFLGLMNGFEYLYSSGYIKKMPKPLIVEGYSVQPLYEALHGHRLEGPSSSLADGIMVPNPPRLGEIIEYTRKYDGRVVLVGNNEILNALEKLLDYGFIVEPTSATVYAAYEKLREELRDKTILLPLTGSGLKIIS